MQEQVINTLLQKFPPMAFYEFERALKAEFPKAASISEDRCRELFAIYKKRMDEILEKHPELKSK